MYVIIGSHFVPLEGKVLAHLAKGNVSFCHYLHASVVCRPLTFHILIFSS